ncbi:hypothetical protein GH714_041263 [Hevea brasiliensis]|uniref:Pentatricopeptide repeat-containing protein n=1 Tax=Hevea brasiliensis TaxID=3981 RepID=A0A6A6MWR5_HEVBR|nr:hypothetical protein GH714_041263 [Hevea brasiliensis]
MYKGSLRDGTEVRIEIYWDNISREDHRRFIKEEQWPEVGYDLRTRSVMLSDNQEPLISRFKVGVQHSNTKILTQYCKAGNLENAQKLFAEMPERNTVSWNNLISALVRGRLEREALYVCNKMIWEGFVPTHFTLASVLSACGTLLVECGRRCHNLAVKIGLEKNVYVINALLSVYAKCGLVRDAFQLFEDMQEPNEVTFTTMMGAFAQTDRVVEALEMFSLMYRQGIQIDSVSLSSVLGVCTRGACGESGFYDGSLCSALGKLNGDMDSADEVFANLPEVSVVSWNIMIAGYGQKCNSEKAVEYLQKMRSCGFEPDEVTYINMLAACFSLNALDKEALTLFQQMRQNGMSPTQFSYATILSCCARLSSLFQGRLVHAQIAKEGFMDDVYVGSALIDMYCKCGEVDEARQFFDMMPDKNTVTWNEMIHGYAQTGRGCEAVNLYRSMIRSGEKPDGITFVAVLTACSHSGLVDTAVEIFDSIQRDHGLEPILDHYTCIIDALARAGQFVKQKCLWIKCHIKTIQLCGRFCLVLVDSIRM